MDQSGSQFNKGKAKRTDKSRRSWTMREEEILIAAVKDIVAKGWKADNGFKIGYLQVLEQSMKKEFPSTDLKATPHINSKIHVWKKNYGSLYSMLSRSGIGWNTSTKMIEAEDDAWEIYVKVDSNARLMRYKSWPFYNDWVEIFGKDRATGENAHDFVEVVSELLASQTQKESEANVHINSNFGAFEDENEIMSVSQAECSTANATKPSKKKRKMFDNGDVSEMMCTYWDKAATRLEEIVTRIGYEHDTSKARKELFGVLGGIDGLNLQEKLLVSNLLVQNKERLDLFFSLPDEAKAEYVRMILSGNL